MTQSHLKSHFAFLLIPLLGALALLAGCGDGGSSLSKAEFIRQGDAICKKADKEKQVKIEEFLQESGYGPNKPLSDKQQEEYVTVAILPPISKALDELNGLGVPDEQQAKAVVEGAEKVVSETEEDPAKLSSGKTDPFAEVAKKAKSYGFKECFVYY